jgi:hypothetical protein
VVVDRQGQVRVHLLILENEHGQLVPGGGVFPISGERQPDDLHRGPDSPVDFIGGEQLAGVGVVDHDVEPDVAPIDYHVRVVAARIGRHADKAVPFPAPSAPRSGCGSAAAAGASSALT